MKTIPLTQGQIALVSDEDYSKLLGYTWHAHWRYNKFYAGTNIRVNGKFRSVQMHRFILGCKPGDQVDHIDRNGLNNQRSNIRVVTRSENLRNRGKNKNNTSGLKGVAFNRWHRKWQAYITRDRKIHHLGYFLTPKEAHAAYCAAAKKLHGEFARFA